MFNESQARSLVIGFRDLHRRMAEMEAWLIQAGASTAFSEYVNDVSPTEGKVLRDYFTRIRDTMLACLQEAHLPREEQRTSLRWAIQCGLTFLHIAVSEMSPKRLRGYGSLSRAGEAEAVRMQQELTRWIDRAAAYLRQGLGRDLAQRLSRLEATSGNVATLRLLDRVSTRWGLVEFRPQLDAVVRRLETPQFEIAIFGRVSSGKSSLLNQMAGTDVLPVGVTPVTAVPTRLTRGPAPVAVISFAEIEPRRIDVTQLRDFAAEEGNPGNHKHVTGILVQLPSPRLPEGVVLVDTPGIGSLALAGSAETFAYLPRCDLGVVLIDAASSPSHDDLALLRLLTEAGIPTQVLLSKADLVQPADRERLVTYLRKQIHDELGLDLPVHPVSTVEPEEALLGRWFNEQIAPLFDRQQALTQASLGRKIAHLRESVVAVLETLLDRRPRHGTEGRARGESPAAGRLLEEADRIIGEAQSRMREWTAEEPALMEIILRDAAEAIVAPLVGSERDGDEPLMQVVQKVLGERGRMAHDLVRGLQQALARTLEQLHQAAPLINADVGSVRNFALSGLPALDLAPVREIEPVARPWWTWLSQGLAVGTVRRTLERRLAGPFGEAVRLYDRQLQAWLKGRIAQVTELYEAQAEVIRQQARRLRADRDAGSGPGNTAALADDLRELQRSLSMAPALGPARD